MTDKIKICCPYCKEEYVIDPLPRGTKVECACCGRKFFIEEDVKDVELKKASLVDTKKLTKEVKEDIKDVKLEQALNKIVTTLEASQAELQNLRNIKKGMKLVSFVCWPIVITMILNLMGMIIGGATFIFIAAGVPFVGVVSLDIIIGLILLLIAINWIMSFNEGEYPDKPIASKPHGEFY